MRRSLKSISNIKNIYGEVQSITPIQGIKSNSNYFIISIKEDEDDDAQSASRDFDKSKSSDFKEIKTDSIPDINDIKKIDINDMTKYLTCIYDRPSITGENGKEYIIKDITIQEILYYLIDDPDLFTHNKFTNVYYSNKKLILIKHKNYYSGNIFSNYFKLRDYIDDVYIQASKVKRNYNKRPRLSLKLESDNE